MIFNRLEILYIEILKNIIMIIIIKLVHTFIWLIMASACLYILYAGIMDIFNIYLVVSIILLIIEIIVLILNNWSCPLTFLASKHTEIRENNFDIYLPNWLAKYNKIIFGAIFIIGLLLVTSNYISNFNFY